MVAYDDDLKNFFLPPPSDLRIFFSYSYLAISCIQMTARYRQKFVFFFWKRNEEMNMAINICLIAIWQS